MVSKSQSLQSVAHVLEKYCRDEEGKTLEEKILGCTEL